MKRKLLLALPLALLIAAATLITPLGAQPTVADKPSRVLLIMLDGMRSDYLDRFDLPNLEALRDGGVSFPNSRVGYMSSITVISHNVVTSGQLPKNQGWANEIYRDEGNVLGGGAGSLYVMSSAACGDFDLLTRAAGYPKLEQYLGALEADGDARFISIATEGPLRVRCRPSGRRKRRHHRDGPAGQPWDLVRRWAASPLAVAARRERPGVHGGRLQPVLRQLDHRLRHELDVAGVALPDRRKSFRPRVRHRSARRRHLVRSTPPSR